MSKYTTVAIETSVKEELNKLKIHERETYNDVIKRLIEHYKRRDTV